MMSENDIPVYPKVWGEEHWIANKEYCGKKLILKKGYRCSIHHHKVKDETFYLISGKVLMEINDEVRILHPGDKQHISIGDRHRFTGLEDSAMIEFSTHHQEDDSYRDTSSGRISEHELTLLKEKYDV